MWPFCLKVVAYIENLMKTGLVGICTHVETDASLDIAKNKQATD